MPIAVKSHFLKIELVRLNFYEGKPLLSPTIMIEICSYRCNLLLQSQF